MVGAEVGGTAVEVIGGDSGGDVSSSVARVVDEMVGGVSSFF